MLLTLVVAASTACGGAQRERDEQLRQSDFHYQLSLGHFRAREIPQAIEELFTALRLNPDNAEAHFMLGFIFQGRRELDQAVTEYQTALRLRPGWFEVINNLGTAYLELEDWELASQTFEPLTREPTYRTPGTAHNNLGWALFNLHRYDEALDHFRSAIRFQPDLCLAYNNQGHTFEVLGQLGEAKRALQAGLDRPACKKYAEPRYRLANLLIAEGDVDRAVALFRECADAEPSSPFAERCREYVDSSPGR
jgi:Tfp pilus assembly protein PilF